MTCHFNPGDYVQTLIKTELIHKGAVLTVVRVIPAPTAGVEPLVLTTLCNLNFLYEPDELTLWKEGRTNPAEQVTTQPEAQ